MAISTNTALFSLLGTTYGGDGKTNFALPDLDLRTSVGQGTGTGLTERVGGEQFGTASTTLLTSNMPAIVGGVAGAVDNIEPSLTTHYVINLAGIYNGNSIQDLGLVFEFAGNFAPEGTHECDGSLLAIAENDALFSLLGTTYGGDGVTTFGLPDLRGRTIVGADSGTHILGTLSGSENIVISTDNLPSDVHFATGTGHDAPIDNEGPSLALNYMIALQGIFPSQVGGADDFTPFLGEIVCSASGLVPNGWAACNGQLLPINQNQALFSLLGTMYGGNGQTTFALPDLRGRALVGAEGNVGAVLGTNQIVLTLDNLPGLTLEGTSGNDDGVSGFDLAGANAADTLRGHAGDDHLTGRGGNDWLDGGIGNDTMTGGLGDDIYIVDILADVVVEAAGEGTDEIRTQLQVYSLAGLPDIENLAGLGSLGQELTGNAARNRIDGGLGADTMTGGLGNDTYVVDNSGDLVVEQSGEGADSVFSSIDYTLPDEVENLTLTGSAISGVGNALANMIVGDGAANLLDGGSGDDTMTGGGGDDRLDGGIGADVMKGGVGNDLYIVDNALDRTVEGVGQGTDTVNSSVTFKLTANLEELVLTGSAAIDGTGNSLANTMTGNGAANRIDGGSGADMMKGGGGDDTYIVDDAGDQAIDSPGGGLDTVKSSVSFSLSGYIENLTLIGSAALDGTGNGLANVMIGNAGANLLKGANGNDQLTGLGGDDTLLGGAGDDDLNGGGGADNVRGGDGDDRVNGGAGSDILNGSVGSDTFVFDYALSGVNVDTIADFVTGIDHIELASAIFSTAGGAGLLASAAFFAGTAAHDADDRIIYDGTTGNIYYDADGIGGAAKKLFAEVTPGLALTNTDFTISGSSAAASAISHAITEGPTVPDLSMLLPWAQNWVIGHEGWSYRGDWFGIDR